MIHAQKSTAVPVASAQLSMIQPSAFAFLNAPKKMTLAARFAPTETRHGEAIAMFIVNVVCATPRTFVVATIKTLTFTLITMANARHYRYDEIPMLTHIPSHRNNMFHERTNKVTLILKGRL
jgi:hypothetical protein